MTDKDLFIEETIINSLKSLLTGRANELLGEMAYPIPSIEFGQSGYAGLPTEFRHSRNSTIPVIALSACERSEKERVILMDAYSLTVTFTIPEYPEGERNCYAYTAAVGRALAEDPTLGGAVDRVVLAGKKYSPPKCAGTGTDWVIILSLRITVEGAAI